MNNMVSVIVPTYNYGKYISEAVESILNQSHPNHEVLVVDDGSTDNTAEIINSFKSSKVRYIFQENQGANVARNRGLRESGGDYIIFLDADDVLDHRHMEKYLQTASLYPGANIYGSWVKGYVEDHGLSIIFERGRCPKDDMLEAWLGDWWIAPCCILWPRQNVLKVEGWDESLFAYQDSDIAMRAIIEGIPFEFCDDAPKGFMRAHRKCISTSQNKSLKHYESKYQALGKIEKILKKRGQFYRRYQKSLAVNYLSLAKQSLYLYPGYSNRCFKKFRQFNGFSKPPGSYMNWMSLLLLGLQRKEKLAHVVGKKIPWRF